MLRAHVIVALLLLPIAGRAAPEVRHDLEVEVDLSERRLVVHHGDGAPTIYEVAIGAHGHATPRGQFAMDSIVWNPGWVPPDSDWAKGARARRPGDPENPMQGAKIFFRKPYYYIHGTNDVESLGDAASHGCVRMNPEDVVVLARVIMEHAGEPRADSWFDWIKANADKSVSVSLPRPVRLNIHE
jgi:murein L,D-transpeptidase YcbB/YkuD